MPFKVTNQSFPLLGGQGSRTYNRPFRLAEPVRILKAEHSILLITARAIESPLITAVFSLEFDLQIVYASRCYRGKTGERIAPAASFLVKLDGGSRFIFRMHHNSNEDRCQHTKGHRTNHNGLPLPRNKREIPERYLVRGIGEAAIIGEPATGAAFQSFILFSQVDSISPVFSRYFIELSLIGLRKHLLNSINAI